MLLELFSLSEIPQSNCIIQTTSPEFITARWNINTARAVWVTLELSINMTHSISNSSVKVLKNRLFDWKKSLSIYEPNSINSFCKLKGCCQVWRDIRKWSYMAECSCIFDRLSSYIFLLCVQHQKTEKKIYIRACGYTYLTSLWLLRSHTDILPSEQLLKQILLVGAIAKA